MKLARANNTVSRQTAAPASPYLYLPMQENTGNAIAYETNLPIGNGSIDATGYAGWDAYRFTPNGTDGYVVDDQRFDELFRLDTLTGGLLILGSMIYSAAPSATEKILQYGAPSRDAPGGMVVEVNANNIVFTVRGIDATVNSSSQLFSHSPASGAVMTFCCYADMANGLTALGINGKWSNALADNDLGLMGAKAPTTTAGPYAFSLFGQHSSAGVVTLAQLNSGTGDVSVSDMWIVRYANDMITNVPKIFQEYHKNPQNRLWSLNNT